MKVVLFVLLILSISIVRNYAMEEDEKEQKHNFIYQSLPTIGFIYQNETYPFNPQNAVKFPSPEVFQKYLPTTYGIFFKAFNPEPLYVINDFEKVISSFAAHTKQNNWISVFQNLLFYDKKKEIFHVRTEEIENVQKILKNPKKEYEYMMEASQMINLFSQDSHQRMQEMNQAKHDRGVIRFFSNIQLLSTYLLYYKEMQNSQDANTVASILQRSILEYRKVTIQLLLYHSGKVERYEDIKTIDAVLKGLNFACSEYKNRGYPETEEVYICNKQFFQATPGVFVQKYFPDLICYEIFPIEQLVEYGFGHMIKLYILKQESKRKDIEKENKENADKAKKLHKLYSDLLKEDKQLKDKLKQLEEQLKKTTEEKSSFKKSIDELQLLIQKSNEEQKELRGKLKQANKNVDFLHKEKKKNESVLQEVENTKKSLDEEKNKLMQHHNKLQKEYEQLQRTMKPLEETITQQKKQTEDDKKHLRKNLKIYKNN
ncbi:MAG: hypothetical protein ACTSXG_01980 [Alphaproteobacteria bacterium]